MGLFFYLMGLLIMLSYSVTSVTTVDYFRHEYLKKKLAIYKKYEDYLLSVVDVLPPSKHEFLHNI